MIPCFSFASQVHPGIKVADDGTIHVGESGRGRKLIRVPLPAGAEVVDGRLVRVPGESGCVVLVHDQSGFRGGWRLREARTPEEWLQIVRRSDAHRPPLGTGALNETAGHVMGDICPACDAICLHPAERSIDPARCKILAEGACAQGDAGRMGGGPEYLLRIAEGYAIECVRSGRLYSSPGVYRLEYSLGALPSVADLLVASVPRAKAEAALAAAKW